MSAAEAVAGTAVRPLETHASWTAADVADSDVWTRRLNVDEIAELEAALVVARSHTHEVLDVDKDRFPLPMLAPVLAQLADELINGRGSNIGTTRRISVTKPAWMYWGIGLHLGVPWPQRERSPARRCQRPRNQSMTPRQEATNSGVSLNRFTPTVPT